MKLLIIIFISIFFSACEMQSIFGKSKQEIELQNKELNAKILKEEKELNAKILIEEKELNLKKEIELAKIDNELKKEELSIKKEEISSQNLKLNYDNNIVILSIISLTIIIIIIAIALFIYFTNRRKDKLRAYEDNLEKYYRQKDREAKMQIANKIVDTIAKGNLSKAQENQLLQALSESPTPKQEFIEEKEDLLELELIDKKKKKKKNKINKD